MPAQRHVYTSESVTEGHPDKIADQIRSEEHTSELQSRSDLVCRLLLEKKKKDAHSTRTLLFIRPDQKSKLRSCYSSSLCLSSVHSLRTLEYVPSLCYGHKYTIPTTAP